MASFVGTLVEFYDFSIYGTAAALVFPKVFFPALGPSAAIVASFAVFGVAFVARPFGSILFGHFGDRLGRKRTLIATMMIMGLATVLVGVMPTTDQIGAAAPILIVLLRIMQGLAAGGEWAGAVLFTAENAPKAKRGVWSMLPSLGSATATTVANATFFITSLTMSTETFVTWGWRVPFIASLVLVAVGMWVRLSVDETAVFKKQLSRSSASRVPLVEAFKRQPRSILLATGTAIILFPFSYIGGAYLASYGTGTLKLDTTFVLGVGMLGGVALFLGIALTGALSDRFGRRRMIMIAMACAIVWSLVLFPIVDSKSLLAFGAAVVLSWFISGVVNGPIGAFLSELFPTRYRYTATGFCYAMGSVIGGAIPPLVAAAVIPASGGFTFGLMLAGLCVVSLVCISRLAETKNYDLDRDGNLGRSEVASVAVN
ncbi:MFS transporter [Arthrobacter sp. SRS-W-1-2016]|uniref:MFS transporter n=1 Tax=Arthrobacter sp. SRS-W-1-2016 TaxID=1930254 RepID=UPI001C0BD532|nr:MFS transporter [Arthrobacter sp. SRS-W-1-2016]